MKTFAKILLFLIFNFSLYANITLNAPDFFVKGESYIFEFEAMGSSVKFPTIDKIDGYVVEDLGTSRSLQIINGNYDEKIIKRYRIVPKTDFEIPKFKFIINNKEEESENKKVTEQKVHKTNSDNFDLTLLPSKKDLYVGEDFIVKLIFKYKRGLQITNLGFESPHFENFWYKKIDNTNKRYEENGYIIQELEFLLFPQKSGKLEIDPLRVDVQMVESSSNSSFSFFTGVPIVEKVYSNKLEFEVKQLPQNLNLIGDFEINATIDKSEINLGESVTYKLDIQGSGNFDDIEDFKLNIPNATIYDNKPEVKTEYSKDVYKGKYTKNFSIVPNSSLEIPSIQLKYFNKNENRVITKKTPIFNIKVNGQKEQRVVLQKPKEEKISEEKIMLKAEISTQDKVLFFILGIMSTLLIFGLYFYVKLQKSKINIKDTPLEKLVKNTKDKNELMKVMVPYLKNDMDLDSLIFECQKSEKEFKNLKKEILKRLKEINL